MALAGFVNVIMPLSVAVNPKCDYFQNIHLGQIYYIYNWEYPNKYLGGTSCRYSAQSPIDTQIVLSCEVIDIPESKGCHQDRLSISLTGDLKFNDGQNYCNNRSLSVVSQKNKLTIGLFSAWYSSGGKFLCTVTAILDEKPTTPSSATCECGWKQEGRIVGGIETGINEFPMMAGLVDSVNREIFCGSTLIGVKYAITAAHCVTKRSPQALGILVGDHNYKIGNETTTAALYVIQNINIHPYYDNITRENDIAVVKTISNIAFGSNVGQVCLPFRFSNYNFTGATVTALGWGTTEFSGPRSDYLQKVNLTVVANDGCQKELNGDQIFKSQLCSYNSEKDACQYDSGGPILWFDRRTRRLQLVGVISYGVGCALDLPGVNTRVTSFLAWIVSVTNDADYCIK